MSCDQNGNRNDADHPYRKIAIDIIEMVIEPLVSRTMPKGLEDELYYNTENVIVDIIGANLLDKNYQDII